MDIDLDFPTNNNPLDIFPSAVVASMVKNDMLVKHPCGVYFQSMPVDEVTSLAAIPYDQAEQYGFFKIDFLHLSLLDNIASKDELRQLIKSPPVWDLLWQPQHTHKLFQMHKHFDVLNVVRPTSIEEVADCIALIRPGKKILLSEYLRDKYKTRPKLYRLSGEDKSSFKRSHAIAYALTIVIQLHLIDQGRI